MLLYGFDPALRHGLLIQTVWENLRLQTMSTIYEWNKKDDISVGLKSHPRDYHNLAARVTDAVGNTGGFMAVDWDFHTVFYRTQKLQVMKMSYFMGFFARAIMGRGISVVYLSPKDVRKGLGLPSNCAKEDTWDAFLSQHPWGMGNWDELNSDKRDSLILTFVLAKALQSDKGRPNGSATTLDLPS